MTIDVTEWPFEPAHFRRFDESPDADFYAQPRLVTHIDDAAIAAVAAFYESMLPEGGRILDLMTSWVSHLGDGSRHRAVEGLGMNEVELEANPVLSGRVVHDLNADPSLPWAEGTFDGAVLTVSVQYLTRPVEVFANAGRVLREGAPLIVTFSNRCFPTKAVALWQMLGDDGHARLAEVYFRLSGAFAPAEAYDISPAPGRSDPAYAVMARALAPSDRRPPAMPPS